MTIVIPQTAQVDMVMPAGPQIAFAVGNGVAILVFIVIAWRHWRSRGSPIGFLFLLAGALAVLNEPVVDVLGKCWFPRHGTWPLFEAFGVVIPAWMLPVYAWYVGGQAFLAYRLFEAGITTRRLFGLYAINALLNALLEIPGLQMGVYSYYGNQPFAVLGFPVWWSFCNALMPLVMAGMAYRCDAWLTGMRRWLVVPMGLMAAGLTNGAVAIPVWLALNGDAGLWGTHLAALCSLGLGLMLCRGVSLMVAVDAGAGVTRPAAAAAIGAAIPRRGRSAGAGSPSPSRAHARSRRTRLGDTRA